MGAGGPILRSVNKSCFVSGLIFTFERYPISTCVLYHIVVFLSKENICARAINRQEMCGRLATATVFQPLSGNKRSAIPESEVEKGMTHQTLEMLQGPDKREEMLCKTFSNLLPQARKA